MPGLVFMSCRNIIEPKQSNGSKFRRVLLSSFSNKLIHKITDLKSRITRSACLYLFDLFLCQICIASKTSSLQYLYWKLRVSFTFACVMAHIFTDIDVTGELPHFIYVCVFILAHNCVALNRFLLKQLLNWFQ